MKQQLTERKIEQLTLRHDKILSLSKYNFAVTLSAVEMKQNQRYGRVLMKMWMVEIALPCRQAGACGHNIKKV